MSASARLAGLRKAARFVSIYGPSRTLYKAAGRLRLPVPAWPSRRRARTVGVIGCGQFAFATIGYFLRSAGHGIAACYDVDPAARDSMARALGIPHRAASVDALLATPGLKTVYIASNHASHAPYAVQALARGFDVYVEKPVAVDFGQLAALERARRSARGRVFAGYNRPFSAAISGLRRAMSVDPGGAFTMQCFVAGHVLAPNHWYRRPGEGTRVCGNIGHWLDLFVHVLAWRGLPERLDVVVASADPSEPDDNLSIAMTSDRGDLFSVMLSSRGEPFEGINESIHVQHGDTLYKIDDFRRSTLWQGDRVVRGRYWPKDVGHRAALLQPFRSSPQRDWSEVVASTLLMLHVADMVVRGVRQAAFPLKECTARLTEASAAP